MTTFAEAEQSRLDAISALREAGLTNCADQLAALPPIVDRETADAAERAAVTAARNAATYAVTAWRARSAAWDAIDALRDAANDEETDR